MFIDSFHQYYMCIQLIGSRFYLVNCCRLGKGQIHFFRLNVSFYTKCKKKKVTKFFLKIGTEKSNCFHALSTPNAISVCTERTKVSAGYLPPASEGWGKVMFSVCSHLGGGGVSPAGGGSGQSSWWGGGQVQLAGMGGVSPARRRGQVQPARGGIRSSQRRGGQVQPAGGGGGQHLAPSCRRYASCVHAGGLSCH